MGLKMAFHPSTRVRYRKENTLDVQSFTYLTELYQAISKPIVFTSYAGPDIDPQEANAIDVGNAAVSSSLLLIRFSNGCEVLCDADQLWGIHELINRVATTTVPIFTSPINGFQYLRANRLMIGDKIKAITQDGYITIASIEAYPVSFTQLYHARVPLFGNYYVVLSDVDNKDIDVVAGHQTSY